MRSTQTARSTYPCIDLGGEAAQSTVEAALLLPAFMLVMLMALQPACLLYTRSIMEGAAAQVARIASTFEGEPAALEAFALRRLSAVPDVSIFHAGGPEAWEVDVDAGAGGVRVSISGRARPLPLLGALCGAFGESDGQGGVLLRAEVARGSRPGWVEGGYDDWVS